jgi:hypothetical protein
MAGFLPVEVSYYAKRDQEFSQRSYSLCQLSSLQNSRCWVSFVYSKNCAPVFDAFSRTTCIMAVVNLFFAGGL